VLPGLGIDEVDDERAGVAAEECVGEGEVAPVEALEVEPGHEHRAAVEEARSSRPGRPRRARR
jgi:hypothetical protein